jgi:cytosine/adenosine deaminase-related metal-dependent hydrolase
VNWVFPPCVALLGPELEPWHCRELIVEDGKIARVTKMKPAPVLDSGALVVIPSLCNAHTHMGDSCLPDGATGMTLEEGFFRPKGYKYRQLKERGRSILPDVIAHLAYMAQSGTTAHIDFREMGIEGTRILRTASASTGVDSVILGQFAELPFSDAELTADQASLPESAKIELAALLAEADGFSESTMNDLTSAAWREIREVTSKEGKLRAIHCLENEGYRNVSLERTGQGDLIRALELYNPHLVIHLTVAEAEEIALLVDHGTTGVLNPRANANLGLPLPPIRDLLEAGVNLLLGTDNGLLNSPNMLAELDFTYKLAKSQYGNATAPDPLEILKMATVNAGKVLGDRFPGYLAEGLPANLCMLDFRVPHLRHTRHLPASIVTRATPAEVLLTLREGNALSRAKDCPLP